MYAVCAATIAEPATLATARQGPKPISIGCACARYSVGAQGQIFQRGGEIADHRQLGEFDDRVARGAQLGDEFVIHAPDCDAQGAQDIAGPDSHAVVGPRHAALDAPFSV
jgi:hypothetical protein